MTVVSGRVARNINPQTFAADITDLRLSKVERDGLTFDGDLSDEDITAIRDRMTSRDDDDQAARAGLRELCADIEADTDVSPTVKAAVCGVISYLLD